MRRFPFYTSISAALLLAACATAPEAADTGPPPETVIAQALADSNPYDAEAMLSELLARNSLTAEQRVQALYHRGSLRRQAADNRLGAIEDFEALLKIAPDHALAANARTELDYVRTDVEQIKVSMNRFLTLAQWFDGTWTLGGHEEAVARYRACRRPLSRSKHWSPQAISVRQASRMSACTSSVKTGMISPGCNGVQT